PVGHFYCRTTAGAGRTSLAQPAAAARERLRPSVPAAAGGHCRPAEGGGQPTAVASWDLRRFPAFSGVLPGQPSTGVVAAIRAVGVLGCFGAPCGTAGASDFFRLFPAFPGAFSGAR